MSEVEEPVQDLSRDCRTQQATGTLKNRERDSEKKRFNTLKRLERCCD